MSYFIFTFEIYLNSIYKAGGTVGRITVLNAINQAPIIRKLTQYYTRVFSKTDNITVKILNVKKVERNEYLVEAIDFTGI